MKVEVGLNLGRTSKFEKGERVRLQLLKNQALNIVLFKMRERSRDDDSVAETMVRVMLLKGLT